MNKISCGKVGVSVGGARGIFAFLPTFVAFGLGFLGFASSAISKSAWVSGFVLETSIKAPNSTASLAVRRVLLPDVESWSEIYPGSAKVQASKFRLQAQLHRSSGEGLQLSLRLPKGVRGDAVGDTEIHKFAVRPGLNEIELASGPAVPPSQWVIRVWPARAWLRPSDAE